MKRVAKLANFFRSEDDRSAMLEMTTGLRIPPNVDTCR
jgi:hypothetical protein